MNSKEIEGAKQLIEIPDVKAGSYSFIGDSDVTYADIRILLDYIKDLEQENQKYKEVIDKIKELINNDKYYTGNTRRNEKTGELITDKIETNLISKTKILDILKEVK